MIHDGYGARISDLEKHINDLLRDKDEASLKLSDIEKKLLQKIGCLEAKVSLLENSFNKNINTNSESNVLTENDETENIILGEESKSATIYDRKELNCKLCDKVFKTESNLLSHDKKVSYEERH